MKWLQVPILIPNKKQEDELNRLDRLGIPTEDYDKQYFIVDGEINLNSVCLFYPHNSNVTMFEMKHKDIMVGLPMKEIQDMLDKEQLKFEELLNMSNTKTKGDIEFNEEEHSYTNINTEAKYTSATTWLKQFTEEFIPDESKTKSTQKKLNISHQEVLDLWEDKKNEAGKRGSLIHLYIEDLLKGKDYFKEDFININKVEKNNILEYLYKISLLKHKKCKLKVEDILHNEEIKVAGQSDLVQIYKKHIVIRDWKTNQKSITELKSAFNNKKMKFPFNYLLDSTFNKYILQLCLYAIFAEEEYELPVKNIYIVHINNEVTEYKIPKVLFNKVKKTLKQIIYG